MNTSTSPRSNKPAVEPYTPVVIASGPNMDQWPRSRFLLPVQFDRPPGKLSAFQKSLQFTDALKGANQAIICINSSCLDVARQQLRELELERQPLLMVEPVDRGTLASLTMAVMMIAKSTGKSRLLIIDPSKPLVDANTMNPIIKQVLSTPHSRYHTVFLGNPMQANKERLQAQIVLKKGVSLETALLYRAKRAEENDTGQLYHANGVAISRTEAFLSNIEARHPRIVRTCLAALSLAEEYEGGVWPSLNIWSTLDKVDWISELAHETSRILLRPVRFSTSSKLQITDKQNDRQKHFIKTDCNNCSISADGHFVVADGVDDLQIVATRDATLVTRANRHLELTKIAYQMKDLDMPEVVRPKLRSFNWGSDCEIDREQFHSVNRIELLPDTAIPLHFHRTRNEHWVVLSGIGSASIGNQEVAMTEGTVLEIPSNTVHSCRNSGKDKLVLLEIRRGTIARSDHVVVSEDSDQLLSA